MKPLYQLRTRIHETKKHWKIIFQNFCIVKSWVIKNKNRFFPKKKIFLKCFKKNVYYNIKRGVVNFKTRS